MEISTPPQGFELEYEEIFTEQAIHFLVELVTTFRRRVDEILMTRKSRKLSLDEHYKLPGFLKKSPKVSCPNWTVAPLPTKLTNRRLDLGDVSPSNSEHLKSALNAAVQGIQVDFDDGCCPSFKNIIKGIHNIVAFTNNKFYPGEVPLLESAPVLMLRPRAFNMTEHNIVIHGREIPGPLTDYGLLMFHLGKILADHKIGPCFYLSKVEGALEASLWNDIFVWTQTKLSLPQGTIKACVLIENILASFEMEEILYELRDHSLGLNCGIWDYAASFVAKFGSRAEFLLPDRNKYVNMDKHFLASYMKLVVQTCRRREAMATGGMAALTLSAAHSESERMEIIEKVCKAKLREIHLGVDGFMVYDPQLVPWINELWTRFGSDASATASGGQTCRQILHENVIISANDLLQMPTGGVTVSGLMHNIKVGICFINSWLAQGKGHFILDGSVEDSATAEISRSQVWQWIYHLAKLEDGTKELITKSLVSQLAWEICKKLRRTRMGMVDEKSVDILDSSCQIFLEVVTASEFPDFITTYLYNHSWFRKLQES